MIRVGLIGTGKHGSRYAQHIINDCSYLHLSAISRQSKEGKCQADVWGARWFSDWTKLIESDCVDAVICVVPPVLNLAIARKCREYNKPLLVEKPLAGCLSDGKEIVRMSEDGSLRLTVGQTLRYNPVISTLKSECSRRGQLITVYANQRLEPSGLSWLDDPEKAGAGITFHTAVHVFDALHYITGAKIVRISAICRFARMSYCEDIVHAMFEMENEISGVVDFSKISQARSGRYEFVFEHSQLHGDQIHGTVSSLVDNRETMMAQFDPIPTIVPLLEDWHTFLIDQGPNPVDPKDGLYAISVSDGCLRSSAGSCWVDVA